SPSTTRATPSSPPPREIERLRKLYGPGHWRKRKDFAKVKLADGEVLDVELHWYEATGIGEREFKIKRYL
ncbi:hypothetical protein, partial [Endothiovibrio diazotrophicus]